MVEKVAWLKANIFWPIEDLLYAIIIFGDLKKSGDVF